MYEMWLGCSQERDAKECIEALRLSGIHQVDWIIIDHYGIDSNWEYMLRTRLSDSLLSKILVIDDLANRAHDCDCLVDQNYFGEVTDSRYMKLVPSSDNFLGQNTLY